MPLPTSADENKPPPPPELAARPQMPGKAEWASLGVLAVMVVYFLANSWRKWPDPIVDFGQQCYSVWRLSQGAALSHDFIWSYGPVSIFFNATLFRLFGPGIMVLVAVNLIVYGLILALAYVGLRRAWGWPGACAALAVFISVFSFLHLLAVGNYNYATPYSAESTQGMLLILVTAFVVARWYREPSRKLALALGLCGGLAAVMKPEFMLATGVLGMAALGLRFWQGKRVTVAEMLLLAAGVVLPTVVFMLWFARKENWSAAFIDANQAWWVVVVQHIQSESGQQMNFSGFDHPWSNVWVEVKAAAGGVVVLAAIWAAGWLGNRPWSALMRAGTALAALALVYAVWVHAGWFTVGRCLPGLVAILFIVMLCRLRHEMRTAGHAQERTVMGFVLVLLAGVMLARMPLFARVFHLGFFQAALAAMVVAAAMVGELPRLVGAGVAGRVVTVFGCALALGLFCVPFALKSREIRADQTEPVGWGRDRFYSTTRTIDGTGALVNWAAEWLRPAPPETTVLVLPEGTMINYLSRHKTLEPGWMRGGNEEQLLQQMRERPPDFVVLISRDLSEFGVSRFGTPGNFGYEIVKWLAENYVAADRLGGDPLKEHGPPGAIILRRKGK